MGFLGVIPSDLIGNYDLYVNDQIDPLEFQSDLCEEK